MFEFYEKRKLKKVLYSRFSIGCLVLLSMALLVPTVSAYQKMQKTQDLKNEVAQELHELRIRESGLTEEIDRLSTPLGIEEELRSKYDVGRAGERMIIIVEE